MTDFRSRFQVPDDGQIRERLLKDLKGRNPDSLNWEFEEFSLPPLTTAGEAPLGRITRSKTGWKTGMDLSEAGTETSEALEIVKNLGAEAVILPASEIKQQDLSGFRMIFVIPDPENKTPPFENFYLADDRLIPGAGAMQSIPASQVNARAFRETGASLTAQYAIALAKGHENLLALMEAGTEPSKATGKLWFSFSSGLSYLPEIAGLRAFRLLWKEISASYLPDPPEAFVTMHTSERYLSHMDTYTNLLRSSTQAMSAISGGTDVLFVLPHDYAVKNWNPFSARLAINIQHILREESYFDAVSDPAAGAYYIEMLTNTFAGKIWEEFQTIEKNGGFIKQFSNGSLMQQITDQARQQEKEILSGKKSMIGVNKYLRDEDPSTARKPVLSSIVRPKDE